MAVRGPVLADASVLTSGGLHRTPSSPPTPFPRQRQKTRMDTSWTEACPSPFTYLPLPAPTHPLYRNVPLLTLCGRAISTACMLYAYRLKCARRLCLCVPECEITPSGMDGQPARPGVLAISWSQTQQACTSGMRQPPSPGLLPRPAMSQTASGTRSWL